MNAGGLDGLKRDGSCALKLISEKLPSMAVVSLCHVGVPWGGSGQVKGYQDVPACS